jgi:hypothetical protein
VGEVARDSPGLMRPRACGRGGLPRVLVVGAGVSGCACGATIAEGGFAVTIVNSALDTVGLLGFGPDLCGAGECVDRVLSALDELPSALKGVWLDSCVVPKGGPVCVAVDRRRLSVETKRLLEGIDGVQFRQGMVVNLRPVWKGGACAEGAGAEGSRDGSWCLELETAFGEVIEGEVVVVAPGLGLGGTVSVGEQVMVGGRYGETPSEGLRQALEELGAEWKEVLVRVGPRFLGVLASEDEGVDEAQGVCGLAAGGAPPRDGEAIPLREVLETGRAGSEDGSDRAAKGAKGVAGRWSADYPPSPHWCELDDVPGFARCSSNGIGAGKNDSYGEYPDGRVSRECYVLPGHRWPRSDQKRLSATRLEHEVSGLAVANLEASGRLVLAGEGSAEVWVAGRAAGAADYLESLSSGVRVGRAIAEMLCHLARQSWEPGGQLRQAAEGGA